MLIISSVVLLLTLIVVVLGSYIVSFFSTGSIPDGVKLGELSLGGLTLKDANKNIDDYFPDYIKKRSVTLSIDGKTYIIPMEDINVRLDKDGTMNKILGKSKYERVIVSIKGIFEKKERLVEPIYDCDEKLLALKIYEIKGKTDRVPMDANIFMKDDKIEKKPEIMGLELAAENSTKTIKAQLKNGNIGPIFLNPGTNADFRLVAPLATMAKMDEIDGIIGKGTTLIEDEEKLESIKLAAKAINGVLITKKETKDNVKPAEFSFYKFLENDGFKVTKYNAGVNQVASTLYAALIKTGFSTKDIDIVADLEAAEYNPSIKRIKVTGTISDFKFRNNMDSSMLIKAMVQDERVIVYILGKMK